jgi:hypothetical protein
VAQATPYHIRPSALLSPTEERQQVVVEKNAKNLRSAYHQEACALLLKPACSIHFLISAIKEATRAMHSFLLH